MLGTVLFKLIFGYFDHVVIAGKVNGLLREFYPKGHNLSRISPKTLKKNLALINARPKKILNFQKLQDLFELFLKKCCT